MRNLTATRPRNSLNSELANMPTDVRAREREGENERDSFASVVRESGAIKGSLLCGWAECMWSSEYFFPGKSCYFSKFYILRVRLFAKGPLDPRQSKSDARRVAVEPDRFAGRVAEIRSRLENERREEK